MNFSKLIILPSLMLLAAIQFSAAQAASSWQETAGSRQEATVLFPDAAEYPDENLLWKFVYESYGFAPALLTSNGTLYVSGMIIRLDGEGDTYQERYANGIRKTFELLEKFIAPSGATLDDIVEITSYHTDLPRQMDTILHVRKELMNLPHPAWTAIGTTSLADPDGQTEIKFTLQLKSDNKK